MGLLFWSKSCRTQMNLQILDIVADGKPGDRVVIDLAVTHPACPSGLRAGAATRDGASAKIIEGMKQRKHPGITVTPFVVETLGHFGECAHSFLRAIARDRPRHERGRYISGVMQELSVALQKHNAMLVAAAIAPPPSLPCPPAPAAAAAAAAA